MQEAQEVFKSGAGMFGEGHQRSSAGVAPQEPLRWLHGQAKSLSPKWGLGVEPKFEGLRANPAVLKSKSLEFVLGFISLARD